ncbi:MAG: hypothetical protein IPH52_27670 [Leptospiraceae bacterium]|nr:hypothetical protein [Leptospiraceae bacterium]
MNKKISLLILSLLILFSVSVLAQEEESSGSSSGGTQSGFTVKGGIWGLGGKVKTELEDKYFTDDLLNGFGFGQYNLGWSSPSKLYPLNPIGLDYYMSGIGPGSLLLGAEMRGIPGLAFTGYTPKYDFISVNPGGSGIVGIHNADLNFKNLDLNVGYQLAFGSFLVTPKFQFRNFVSDFKESGTYLYNGGIGIRNTTNNQNTWSGFIGANLLYNINAASAVYLEYAMDSPILGQISSSGDFNKTSFRRADYGLASGSTTILKKTNQEIRGSIIDLGYQHSFGALGLRVGYRGEELRTSYSTYTDVPLAFSNLDQWRGI